MSRRINTSKKSHFNSSTINTYKNARLKVVQNQHLQKNRGGGGVCICFGTIRAASVALVRDLPEDFGHDAVLFYNPHQCPDVWRTP